MRLRKLSPIWTLRIWTGLAFALVTILLTSIAYTSMIQLRREKYLDYLRAAKDMRQAVFARLQRERSAVVSDDAKFFEEILRSAAEKMSATSKIGMDVTRNDQLVTRFNRLSLKRRLVIENDDGIDFLRSALPEPYEKYTISFFTDAIPLPLPARVLGLQIALYTVLVPCTFAGLYYAGSRSIRLSEERLQMAAMVGHELRTPLTSLKMHLEMIEAGMFSGGDERAEYTSRSLSQVDRLINTVHGMLTVSKPDEFDSYRPEEVSVDEFADLTTNEVQSLAKTFGLSIPIEVEPAIQQTGVVTIQRQFLTSILSNLVENAVKYGSATSTGLKITIRTRRKRLELGVVDFGRGFERGEIRNVFRPFHRGRQARELVTGGTGLGLAVVKTYVRRLGGSIRIGGNEKGARIVVSLPMRQKSNSRAAAQGLRKSASLLGSGQGH